MRKLEEQMLTAVKTGKPFCLSNTTVVIHTPEAGNGKRRYLVSLFGNTIAEGFVGQTPFRVNLCGWASNTTFSRLRALGVDAKRQNGEPMIGGDPAPVDGWVTIKPRKY